MVIGAIAMKGNPFFAQKRPGKKDKTGKERIFKLIKFRTMSNAKDKEGNLLPDAVRLNKYGKFLRTTSLDELPELFNIFVGDMAIIGPRPQLVRDMVFMSDEQRKRHDVRPGLSGLAQVSGRNNISWEQKFEFDLNYINLNLFMIVMIIVLLMLFIEAILMYQMQLLRLILILIFCRQSLKMRDFVLITICLRLSVVQRLVMTL